MPSEILIVNGSQDRRHVSRELLERAGYRVNEIVSLDEAVSEARRSPPLAVVVAAPGDIAVPVRFTKRLRRHPLTRNVPVLVTLPDAWKAAPREQERAMSWIEEPLSARRLLEEIAYLTRPDIRGGPFFGAPPPRPGRGDAEGKPSGLRTSPGVPVRSRWGGAAMESDEGIEWEACTDRVPSHLQPHKP